MSKGLKTAGAFFLGALSLPLLFLLGEGVSFPATIPGARYLHMAIFIAGMGGYFLLAEFLLSRGRPQPVRKDWPIILALNFALLVTALIALAVESNKSAACPALGTAILAVGCSYLGALWASRSARRRPF